MTRTSALAARLAVLKLQDAGGTWAKEARDWRDPPLGALARGPNLQPGRPFSVCTLNDIHLAQAGAGTSW